MKKILGVSGSPIFNSNTDRTVKKVLESSGLKYKFIKLSDYNIGPCRACLACVKTNRCVIKDDFQMVEQELLESSALVVGGYTPFGMIDAFTKSFLERLYATHHKNLNKGKIFASIISSLDKKANEEAHKALAKEALVEKMIPISALSIEGNFMCNKCGLGNECENSGIKRRHGNKLKACLENMVNVEDQDVWIEAEKLGKKIREYLI